MLGNLLWVCLGGAVGSGARYLVGLGAHRWLDGGLPYGTLTVNIVGSFLLGSLLEALGDGVTPGLRLALTTGAMGGFTTYSTFNFETLTLLESGRWLAGGGYLALTVLGCLLAGLGGILCGRLLSP